MVAEAGLIIAGLYVSIGIIYTLFLLGARFYLKEKEGDHGSPGKRFGILIPAHNEELLLPRLLRSIRHLNYPRELIRTIVITDHCSDDTSRIASQSGAETLERSGSTRMGKGHALKWAIERIDMHGIDAVLVVDADSILNKQVLLELDRFLEEGEQIVQCYNGVANPDESWFTGLLDVSRSVGNEILHPAKELLGLSSCLMGNGMCFSRSIIERYGWDALTIGEDWEYYSMLISNGERVAFARKAHVYHQESSSLRQATRQRMRWSSGRFAIAWRYGIRSFYKGLREGNLMKIDASMPLLLPNPSLAMNMSLVLLGAAYLLSHGSLQVGVPGLLFLWFSSLIAAQLVIFAAGLCYTSNRRRRCAAVVLAPIFLFWKMLVDICSLVALGKIKWRPTERRL